MQKILLKNIKINKLIKQPKYNNKKITKKSIQIQNIIFNLKEI